MPVGQWAEDGKLRAATIRRRRAAWRERAARRLVERAQRATGYRDERTLPVRVHRGNRGQQGGGVGVSRSVNEGGDVELLDDPARVHHEHARAKLETTAMLCEMTIAAAPVDAPTSSSSFRICC